jgi:hypothetical protein
LAIYEAMLNAQNATGRDPTNPAYYPQDPTQYRASASRLANNNDLLNQIYQEMAQVHGGSNVGNYPTDWASGGVAANERRYATPTWTSPTNEQFFRKDISNPWTGALNALQNQDWLRRAQDPWQYVDQGGS